MDSTVNLNTQLINNKLQYRLDNPNVERKITTKSQIAVEFLPLRMRYKFIISSDV